MQPIIFPSATDSAPASQKFAAYDESGDIEAFYDSEDSPVPIGLSNIVPISYAQWQECIYGRRYRVENGVLIAPTADEIASQESAVAWSIHQRSAKDALDASDRVVLRCYEHSVQVPDSWRAYRSALRLIVSSKSGDPTQPLPIKPDYPPGT